MQNYFTYFTEIEEHYQRRRGTGLLLSTLDWALIETWKDAGIPLEAVLRGIDETFDKYERKPPRAKTKKINSLAYCSQEVLAATEEMREAATGATRKPDPADAGFEDERVRSYLRSNAEQLNNAQPPATAQGVIDETAERLATLASAPALPALEDLERNLTMLEEKIFGALLASAAEAELLEMRTQADREIAPYRSKMGGPQLEQLARQFVNKRLLERARVPRLSLFYL
jgi:hypothetical protein